MRYNMTLRKLLKTYGDTVAIFEINDMLGKRLTQKEIYVEELDKHLKGDKVIAYRIIPDIPFERMRITIKKSKFNLVRDFFSTHPNLGFVIMLLVLISSCIITSLTIGISTIPKLFLCVLISVLVTTPTLFLFD